MSNRLIRLILAVMVAITAYWVDSGPVLASLTTGSVSGTITDSAGLPLANVAVSAVAPSGTATTITGSNGFYAITGLAPDTYTLTFTKAGLQPQQVAGITVTQGQTTSVSLSLSTEPKVLAKLLVRGATSLIQPKSTADTYTINAQGMQNVTGTPQNISETAVLDSLPGITTDRSGYPIIRGGAENEEGYSLEGIDATDPISGQFINSLSLAGTSRVVLSTGGYDVSAGNTNSGVVNEVIRRGTYPGEGQATVTLDTPEFDHRLAFEYGNGSPDNRFSYFMAFNGLRQFRVYGDPKVFLPSLVGQVGNAAGNIAVTNLFYRWGSNNANELEYLGETGASLFQENYGVDPRLTPYGSANAFTVFSYQSLTGGFDFTPFLTLYPGQKSVNQVSGYPDNENNNHTIEKLNYKRQFTASSFGDFYAFRTIESDVFLTPWGGGALFDFYEHNVNNNLGVAFDYTNQLNSKNLVGVGAETIYTQSKFDIGNTTSEPFIFGPFAGASIDCYVQPQVINGSLVSMAASFCPGFTGGTPLATFPANQNIINDGLHRNNLWVKDTFTPNDKLTADVGVRWDQELLGIPGDAQAQTTTYVINASGQYVEIPGPPINSDVTRPSQLSPRIALSYHSDPLNVFTASYGRNIEFTPFSNIEDKLPFSQVMANCTIANGCFQALPGFGTTNNVTNLMQAAIEAWNTNNFAQYTPVKPQTASNYDVGWSHDFGRGLEMRIEPYYRVGFDYVVANTPLLTTLPDGTPVFGAPREQNSGYNKNTGVEFALDKNASYGLSGFVHVTYDNTLANYNSDFFPATNNAALALRHMYHVSYLAPITATLNLNYNSHRGFHVAALFPYESGYRYGVGKHTFVFNGTTPVEVLNTDLASTSLAQNPNTSAYYFTDPTNPGTILNPNIVGSRGTPDGNDPGTLRGPQVMTMNLQVYHDVGAGINPMEVGFRVENVFGNYTDGVIAGNSRYRNNGLGGFSSTSGTNTVLPLFEPFQYPRSPLPFENEPTGPARTYTFFVSSKF